MSARYLNEPHHARHNSPPPIVVNPHSATVIGKPPIVDLVLDLGPQEQGYVIKLPSDLAFIIATGLAGRLHTPGSQNV